ncbi:hypothetical protein PA598K_06313 [Paenibacillus sp. 598K]|uniref:extracellular solute-binding protein n=1 Tax=Paenibacillus sp. 598K TaxID=1117987 RepID=UPI000FF91AE1|nr:extracellular solute-binding protein [Paenibacillus sp. 598K]GBF77748.1 hypothetical protein PA598K_06313 [Paenibacillus sp. 598K]
MNQPSIHQHPHRPAQGGAVWQQRRGARHRGVSLLMLLLCAAIVLGACSNGGALSSQTTEGGEAAAPDQSGTAAKSVISASIYDRGQVASDEGTYEDNRWTRYINEQSGVQVQWMPIPRNQEADKFNVLIASEQAPDLMSTYNRDFITRWATEGAIQPLDDYIEQYSTSYKNYLTEHPELKPYLTLEDGKMYAIASLRPTRGSTAVYIRQDWLDALKLEMPASVDELLEVARAFRDYKEGVVPMAMSTAYQPIVDDWFMARSGEWFVEDEQVVQSFFTERYADAMAFRQLVYHEGLVDKEYATDKEYSRQRQLWTTGRSGIYFANINDSMLGELLKNEPEAKLAVLPPLETKYGTNGYQLEVPNFLLTAFNKDMADPEAAIRFIDWLIDGGWEPMAFGFEGEHYELKDGIPVTTDLEKWQKEVAYANEYRLVHQEQQTPDYLRIRAGEDPVDRAIAELKTTIIENSQTYAYRKDIPYVPPVQEYAAIATQFEAKWKEINVRMSMTDTTPEQAVAELRSAWNSLGGEAVTVKVQEWYGANKDKWN